MQSRFRQAHILPWKANHVLHRELNEHGDASGEFISECLAKFFFKRKVKLNKIIL